MSIYDEYYELLKWFQFLNLEGKTLVEIKEIEAIMAERILYYKKDTILKHFNRYIPYAIFPIKMYKIEDISFAVLSSGTLLILLSIKGDTPIEITLENEKAKLYSAPGTTKVGPRVKYDKQLISKTEDILLVYFRCLEIIRECNPNKTTCFGNCDREQLEMFAESERINSELEKHQK